MVALLSSQKVHTVPIDRRKILSKVQVRLGILKLRTYQLSTWITVCNSALHFIGTDGLRQDTASRYVHPKIQSEKYPGLNVLVDTQVKCVIFEGKRAIGFEIRPNP